MEIRGLIYESASRESTRELTVSKEKAAFQIGRTPSSPILQGLQFVGAASGRRRTPKRLRAGGVGWASPHARPGESWFMLLALLVRRRR